MAESTGIGWADATFNPWIGCEKVSPGCAHCYAETLVNGRMGRPGTWGADGVRQVTSDSNWKKPLRWARLAEQGLLPDGKPNLDGHRPRIFCASLADVFEDRDELEGPRFLLFDLIEATPQLDWLLLTKRPEEMRDWLSEWTRLQLAGEQRDIPQNIWLGVSIENSRQTWRADVLREIPAAVRFISAEPLLDSLFRDRVPTVRPGGVTARSEAKDDTAPSNPLREGWNGQPDSSVEQEGHGAARGRAPLDLTGIDWIIIGGESGKGARPFHLGHAREIINAARCPDCYGQGWVMEPSSDPHLPTQVGCQRCDARGGGAVFVKQLGAKPIDGADHRVEDPRAPAWDYTLPIQLRDRKGEDPSEWPAELRIQEFPETRVHA